MGGPSDPLLELLRRLDEQGVRYILVGGHAVRLNGFLRYTEDIDLLLPRSAENGERAKQALAHLPSAEQLQAAWFEPPAEAPENIRIADDILVDILFAANGETYESLQPHVVRTKVEGVPIVTLDIEGLLKTKTDFRDKDRIDREALERLLAQIRERR